MTTSRRRRLPAQLIAAGVLCIGGCPQSVQSPVDASVPVIDLGGPHADAALRDVNLPDARMPAIDATSVDAPTAIDARPRDARTPDDAAVSCEGGCPDGSRCVRDGCHCELGRTLCDGGCVDLWSDERNCGRCGVACPSRSRLCPDQTLQCEDGFCSVACGGGTCSCPDSPCVDLETDRSNCGACGRECEAGQVCRSGECVTIP